MTMEKEKLNKEEQDLLISSVIYLANEKKYWKDCTFMSLDFIKTMMMLSSIDDAPVDFAPYYDQIDEISKSELLPQFKQKEIDKITEKMHQDRYNALAPQLGFILICLICKENKINFYSLQALMNGYTVAWNANNKNKAHDYSDIFKICRHELGTDWMKIIKKYYTDNYDEFWNKI